METTFAQLKPTEKFTIVGIQADDVVYVKRSPGEYVLDSGDGGWVYLIAAKDRLDLRVRRVG